MLAPDSQRSGINPEKTQRTNERIGHNFKSQSRERRVIFRRPLLDFIGARIDAFDRWNIERRRQKFDHGIEHGLNAFVAESRATQNRHDLER